MTDIPTRQPDELAEKLTRLLEAATKGRWYHYNEVFRRQFGQGRITEIQRRDGKSIVAWPGFDNARVSKRFHNPNAALIVEVVNTLPQLLADRLFDRERIAELEAALRQIDKGTDNATELFAVRLGSRKSPTWHAVNVFQDYLAAGQGTARTALEGAKP